MLGSVRWNGAKPTVDSDVASIFHQASGCGRSRPDPSRVSAASSNLTRRSDPSLQRKNQSRVLGNRSLVLDVAAFSSRSSDTPDFPLASKMSESPSVGVTSRSLGSSCWWERRFFSSVSKRKQIQRPRGEDRSVFVGKDRHREVVHVLRERGWSR